MFHRRNCVLVINLQYEMRPFACARIWWTLSLQKHTELIWCNRPTEWVRVSEKSTCQDCHGEVSNERGANESTQLWIGIFYCWDWRSEVFTALDESVLQGSQTPKLRTVRFDTLRQTINRQQGEYRQMLRVLRHCVKTLLKRCHVLPLIYTKVELWPLESD